MCEIRYFSIVVNMCYQVQNMGTTFHLLATSRNLYEIYAECMEFLQFPRYHPYFRNDFQMLSPVKEGEILSPQHTIGKM